MPDCLNIAEQVCMLRCPNNRDAYRALQSLQEASDLDDAVYAHIDTFIEMMHDSSSYVRTRGLTLIACNAKWDEAGRIDEIIDEYLNHVTHHSPTVHQISPETFRSEAASGTAHRILAQARRHIAICWQHEAALPERHMRCTARSGPYAMRRHRQTPAQRLV